MEYDLTSGKRKIIQKRVKKRERYARMARIRYRKERNVPLVSAQNLPQPPKHSCTKPTYSFYMDLVLVEENGKLGSDYSLLNQTKVCNSVSVNRDKEDMVSVKLLHNRDLEADSWVSTVKEWESKDEIYWKVWASRAKRFSLLYEDFMREYKSMITENKFDDVLTKRQNEYLARRDELLSTQACFELRFKFDKEEMRASEINVTTKLLSQLDYEVDDFMDLVLRNGLPSLHLLQDNGLANIIEKLMENFDTLFIQNVETPELKSVILAKDQNLKRASFSTLIGGFFRKNVPEISVIVTFDKIEALGEKFFSEACSKAYLDKTTQLDKEKQYFLETYYNEELLRLEGLTDTQDESETEKSSISDKKVMEEDQIWVKQEIHHKQVEQKVIEKETNIIIPPLMCPSPFGQHKMLQPTYITPLEKQILVPTYYINQLERSVELLSRNLFYLHRNPLV